MVLASLGAGGQWQRASDLLRELEEASDARARERVERERKARRKAGKASGGKASDKGDDSVDPFWPSEEEEEDQDSDMAAFQPAFQLTPESLAYGAAGMLLALGLYTLAEISGRRLLHRTRKQEAT